MPKTVSPLADMVRKLKTYVPSRENDVEALLSLPHTLKACDLGTMVVHEGGGPDLLMVLVSGFAARQKCTPQGTRQIVSMYVPGDVLNLERLFLNVLDESVQTMSRASVAIIPGGAMRELVRSCSGVADAIVASTLVEGSISREWLLNIGRRDGRARVAHLLCELSLRLGLVKQAQGQGYNLPLNQDQIADALGLTPVHVNRMLKSLEAEGLIKRIGRRITFPRWDALCDVAGFSSRYLYLER